MSRIRPVFTVRLWDETGMDPNENTPISETRAFSINASIGAGECLIKKLGKDEGQRYSRVPYSRTLMFIGHHFAKEHWIGQNGRKVLVWVEQE